MFLSGQAGIATECEEVRQRHQQVPGTHAHLARAREGEPIYMEQQKGCDIPGPVPGQLIEVIKGVWDLEHQEIFVVSAAHDICYLKYHFGFSSDNITRWSSVDDVEVLMFHVINCT